MPPNIEGVVSKSEVTLGKRKAPRGESPSTKRLKLLAVFWKFSAVVRDIGKSMKSVNLKTLMNSLTNMTVSDDPKIPLFAPEFLQTLEQYKDVSTLLNRLSFYWSWIDCSVLEELVNASHCKKAIGLLEGFKSELGQVQILSSLTVPSPCAKMLPNDKQSSTLLALTVECKQFECTLHYISELKLKFSALCGITRHSLQLVAVKQSSVKSIIFYWMISKQIASIICAKVQASCSQFHSNGILEVSVYPGVVMATNGEVRLGSLAFLTISEGIVSD